MYKKRKYKNFKKKSFKKYRRTYSSYKSKSRSRSRRRIPITKKISRKDKISLSLFGHPPNFYDLPYEKNYSNLGPAHN